MITGGRVLHTTSMWAQLLLLLRGWMIVFPGLVSRSAGVQQLLQGAGAHAALRGQALLNVGHQAGHMAPATSTLN